jgi:GNAT superfamily N-acetyltransferase
MKDIPMFTTEFGVASLLLAEIPYRSIAYIRLQTASDPLALLNECVSFCRACGADHIYATGDDALTRFPFHTAVLKMQIDTAQLPETEAKLFPVLPENLEQWRALYNQRFADVPMSAYMTEKAAKQMLADGSGYFVHKDGKLLGIGKFADNKLEAVATAIPGTGQDAVAALCTLATDSIITLEVAGANARAVKLYKKMGFVAVQNLSEWYEIV